MVKYGSRKRSIRLKGGRRGGEFTDQTSVGLKVLAAVKLKKAEEDLNLQDIYDSFDDAEIAALNGMTFPDEDKHKEILESLKLLTRSPAPVVGGRRKSKRRKSRRRKTRR